jgi:hypothetical protein
MPNYERKKNAGDIEPNDIVKWGNWKQVVDVFNYTLTEVNYTKLYFEDNTSEDFQVLERLEVC